MVTLARAGGPVGELDCDARDEDEAACMEVLP